MSDSAWRAQGRQERVVGDELSEGFLSHHTDLGFYSQWNRKVGFEKRIGFIHLGFTAC